MEANRYFMKKQAIAKSASQNTQAPNKQDKQSGAHVETIP